MDDFDRFLCKKYSMEQHTNFLSGVIHSFIYTSTLLLLVLLLPYSRRVTNKIQNVHSFRFQFNACIHLYHIIIVIILAQWEGKQFKWFIEQICPGMICMNLASTNMRTETNRAKITKKKYRRKPKLCERTSMCALRLREEREGEGGGRQRGRSGGGARLKNIVLLRKPLPYHVSNEIKWIQVAYRILFPSLKMKWKCSIASLVNNHSHHVIWNDRPHYYPYSIECV